MNRFLILIMGSCLIAQGAQFWVDASAQGGGDGSSAHPFASPQEALVGVRTARKQGKIKPNEGIEVLFRAGDYFIDQEKILEFSSVDSGSPNAPVVWRGEGAVRFIGGKILPLQAFKPVTDPAICARLSEQARAHVRVADVSAYAPKGGFAPFADVFQGTPHGPIFFVNHRIQTIARWPNQGEWTEFYKPFDKGVKENGTYDPIPAHPGAFIYENDRVKKWHFDEGIWLNGYFQHDWYNQSVKVARYGTENGTNHVMRLAATIPYGVMARGTFGLSKGRRFYVYNSLDELDAPGEWYLDRKKNLLYFYPPEKEPLTELALACDTRLMILAKNLKHFRFEQINLEYNWEQSASWRGVEDIVFQNLKVSNIARGGLNFEGNNVRVLNVELEQIGGAGISLTGGDRKTLTRGNSLIENCRIHDFGVFLRTYGGGIYLGGCGNTVRGNKIYNAPHSAVFYAGNEHLFEYNEVWNVLLETADAGAYYTGRNWTTQGNILRFNYTHDLGLTEGAATMGFYFDDCDCGTTVYGNIFHNISRGIMLGGGRDHPIRNNIFSKCKIALSIDCRGMEWRHWNKPDSGWNLEQKALEFNYTNGVWAAKYPRLAKIMQDYPQEPLYNPVTGNIFIDCTRQLVALEYRSVDKWLPHGAPIENNLVINTHGTNDVKTAQPDKRIVNAYQIVNGSKEKPFDAGFVDPEKGDFRLKKDAWIRQNFHHFIPLDTKW